MVVCGKNSGSLKKVPAVRLGGLRIDGGSVSFESDFVGFRGGFPCFFRNLSYGLHQSFSVILPGIGNLEGDAYASQSRDQRRVFYRSGHDGDDTFKDEDPGVLVNQNAYPSFLSNGFASFASRRNSGGNITRFRGFFKNSRSFMFSVTLSSRFLKFCEFEKLVAEMVETGRLIVSYLHVTADFFSPFRLLSTDC